MIAENDTTVHVCFDEIQEAMEYTVFWCDIDKVNKRCKVCRLYYFSEIKISNVTLSVTVLIIRMMGC